MAYIICQGRIFFFVDLVTFFNYFIIYIECALICNQSHLHGFIHSKMTKSQRQIDISEAEEKLSNKVWRQVYSEIPREAL